MDLDANFHHAIGLRFRVAGSPLDSTRLLNAAPPTVPPAPRVPAVGVPLGGGTTTTGVAPRGREGRGRPLAARTRVRASMLVCRPQQPCMHAPMPSPSLPCWRRHPGWLPPGLAPPPQKSLHRLVVAGSDSSHRTREGRLYSRPVRAAGLLADVGEFVAPASTAPLHPHQHCGARPRELIQDGTDRRPDGPTATQHRGDTKINPARAGDGPASLLGLSPQPLAGEPTELCLPSLHRRNCVTPHRILQTLSNSLVDCSD